jgi:hypothetical protein
LLLDYATLVSLFQLLLHPFFEFRCRRLRTVGKNFGIWHNSPAPLEGRISRSWKLQHQVAFA